MTPSERNDFQALMLTLVGMAWAATVVCAVLVGLVPALIAGVVGLAITLAAALAMDA